MAESSNTSSKTELKSEREQEMGTRKHDKEANARAEAFEKTIAEQAETIKTLQQQVKDKEDEIGRLGETLHHKDERIRQLEESVRKSRDELAQSQRQLENSDRVFQDIFQRLMGQLPQSQPHWVVQRSEIEMTEEMVGSGG